MKGIVCKGSDDIHRGFVVQKRHGAYGYWEKKARKPIRMCDTVKDRNKNG